MTTAQRWRWLLRAEPGEAGSLADQIVAAVNLVPDVVPGALASSITELDGGTYSTSAASSSLALELDVAQYAHGDGPCMTAARDRQLQMVVDTAASKRFTGFAEVALRRGVRSSLSIPISTAYHPAALNIYAGQPGVFDEQGRLVAEFLGRALTMRLQGAAAEHPTTSAEAERVDRRRRLIRAAMERAAGPDTTPAEVFAALAARSAREHRSIYDIASELTGAPEGAT